VQRRLVPGLEDPTFSCVSTETFAVVSRACVPGDLVRVEVTAPFEPITPLLGAFGPFDLKVRALSRSSSPGGRHVMRTQPGTWHHGPRTNRRHERGQIIVIFALALIAMIAMVGLILDGGAAFAHRPRRADRQRPRRARWSERVPRQLRPAAHP
jgi:hypothetical protein